MSGNARRWRRISILIGVTMIFLGVFILAWDSYLIAFTNVLMVSKFVNRQGDYIADVLDNSLRVADILIRLPSFVYGDVTQIPLTVSIWHELGTKLKSLRLTFSSDEILSIALDVPGGYPWPNLEFHHTEDGKGVLFYVADLGLQGSGTVTPEFLVEMASNKQRLNLNVTVQLIMQREAPFTFHREIAEAQVDAQALRA